PPAVAAAAGMWFPRERRRGPAACGRSATGAAGRARVTMRRPRTPQLFHDGPHSRRPDRGMSAAPGAPAHPGDRFDRWQPWIAGLLTAVVHLCLLLAVLLVPPLELDRPRGEDAAGGSVIQVEFIGEG